jgi:hypothetical protein
MRNNAGHSPVIWQFPMVRDYSLPQVTSSLQSQMKVISPLTSLRGSNPKRGIEQVHASNRLIWLGKKHLT